MTETYIPKVGDKVRATLGESVLVGRVAYSDPSTRSADILVGSEPGFAWALHGSDGWQFEQVIDVPTKPFAVVIGSRAQGGYVRGYEGEWTSVFSGSFASAETIAELIRDEGYRVVFEGVDE